MINTLLKIKKLHPDAVIPQYMTTGAAAMDVSACLEAPVTLAPGERKLIPTGFAIQTEQGYAAILCARSGISYKNGIALANGIGVIDSDYTGEVKVSLINNSDVPFTVEKGMRIAQMMIIPVAAAQILEVSELEKTDRGDGGFGSTGSKN
ncbi:MAG: dUTP diphosphatase [Clostridia bacterium]|nr:dUTP diphosphatase [Clostridia bacterium]